MDKIDGYKLIAEFNCYGKQMVTVRIKNAAHVMGREEWNKICGRNHQNKRKNEIDRCNFAQENGYKMKVS